MSFLRTSPCLLFALVALVGACHDGTGAGTGDSSAALDEPSGPYSFRCSLNYRESNVAGPNDSDDDPKFVFKETLVDLSPGDQKSADFGQLTFRANVGGDDKYEGGGLSLSVLAGNKFVASWLYQYNPDTPPVNQFGSQGFTGLVYLTHPESGGDYQFFCHTVR